MRATCMRRLFLHFAKPAWSMAPRVVGNFALELCFWVPVAWSVLVSSALGGEEHVVVRTKSGPVRGLVLNLLDGLRAATFLGIPYAEPPVGALRFKDPVPKEPWTETLNATQFGPMCVQSKSREHWDLSTQPDGSRVFMFFHMEEYPQDEDCLTMNIFVPEEALPERSGDDLGSLPVMFFIHGGSYKTSSSRFFPGGRLAAQGKVVVVTVNYRLGAIGFLSTGDSVVSGNYGLLDQLLAMRWVRENVAAFGGDPSDVTLFGTSAGAACVGLHLLSPMSKGLFAKAIVQSGSPMGEWAVQRTPRKYTERLVRKLNCSDPACSEGMLQCLRKASAELITEKSDDYSLEDSLMLQFAPTVDGRFLTAHPDVLLQREGALGSVPVMVGVTRNEFEDWMERALDTSSIPFTKELLRKYLFHLLRKDDVSEAAADALLHAVYAEYVFGGHSATSPHHRIRHRQQLEVGKGTAPYVEGPASALPDIRTLAKIISDIDLKAPSVKMVKLLSLHPSVKAYLYEFDYVSKDDIFFHSDANGNKKAWVGSYHGSELYYIFGYPRMNLSNSLRLEEDKEVADIMMQLWTDFARSGSPTPESATRLASLQNFSWPPYSEEDDCFAILGLQPFVARSYESERMAFWNHFVPLFTDYPLTTLMANKTNGTDVAEGANLKTRGNATRVLDQECITSEFLVNMALLMVVSCCACAFLVQMVVLCACNLQSLRINSGRDLQLPVNHVA